MNEYDPKIRYKPVPIDYRLLEEKPLKKVEIMKIRNSLDELVDIKNDQIGKILVNENSQEITKPEVKPEVLQNSSNTTFPIVNFPVVDNKVLNNVNTPQLKINLEKIEDNKNSENISVNNKPVNKKVIIRRKLNYMNNDDEQKIVEKIYNVSPEDRRRNRKEEFRELQEEAEVSKAIKTSAELAEQHKRELAELKTTIAKDREELKASLAKNKEDLSNKFSGQFNEITGNFEGKFGQMDGKLSQIGSKLEETCTGIDCLKKDLLSASKANELSECPKCGEKVVPILASYCPNCSEKISGWTEDDGVTPIKNWKPSWDKK